MNQRSGAVSERGLFSPRAPLLLAAVGVVAFGAWLVLSAIGSEFSDGHDGGAHSLSISGTGYAGLVDLVRANDPLAIVSRDQSNVDAAALAILTPDLDVTSPADLSSIVAGPRGATDPSHPPEVAHRTRSVAERVCGAGCGQCRG